MGERRARRSSTSSSSRSPNGSSAEREGSCSASRRRSRRSSSPTSTRALDEQAAKTPSGTPSSRSGPGGPSCRRTRARPVRASLALAGRGSRSRRTLACGVPSRRRSCSGRASSRRCRRFSCRALPGDVGRDLARSRSRRPRVSSSGSRSPSSRSCFRLARPRRRSSNFAQARRAHGARLLVPPALRDALAGSCSSRAHPVGRRVLGLARADRDVVTEQPGRVRARCRSRSVVPASASAPAHLGPPDVLFFALFLAAADRFALRVALDLGRADRAPRRHDGLTAGDRRRRPAGAARHLRSAS